MFDMNDPRSVCAGRAACTPHPTPFTAHCIPPALECEGPMAENKGMIASFARALTEGLSAQQSDEEFNATLADAIDSIYEASRT